MVVQDLSHNLRIASLTKLTRELEQSRTPEQTMRAYEQGQTANDDQTLVGTRVL